MAGEGVIHVHVTTPGNVIWHLSSCRIADWIRPVRQQQCLIVPISRMMLA